MELITTAAGIAQLVEREAYKFTNPTLHRHPDYQEGERRAAEWIALGDNFTDQQHFRQTAQMLADDLICQYSSLNPMMRGWYNELAYWLYVTEHGKTYYPSK